MKTLLFLAAVLLGAACSLPAANPVFPDKNIYFSESTPPHTPTLIYYLSGAHGQKDVDAIRASVQKLKSASTVEVNTNLSYARIRFDSHVVSYHQVAQAVSDAGNSLGKAYNPWLVFFVSGYTNHAPDVDDIFAGKRLNTRVKVTPLDKSHGLFQVRFLPLKVNPADKTPQGFNGGHLHHPISDPPPRGLGLVSGYASDYDLSVKSPKPD